MFFLYALVRTVYFSFTDYDLFSDAVWVGLSNFKALLSMIYSYYHWQTPSGSH
ncbi:hypothetical protein JCM19241_867 [Vibrio ishigakensis]|uniref:Uncharacterized protein n=1 Tax=Vibrio ishigakensis TaxID=1481914 RepID=A0A0B8QIX9_9VIBR|nr:hypothetical protein JCM19241_867 [Vibrio ishigakensis]